VLEPDVSEYETKYESHGIAMVFVKVVNSMQWHREVKAWNGLDKEQCDGRGACDCH
jgi:hypothetical protein